MSTGIRERDASAVTELDEARRPAALTWTYAKAIALPLALVALALFLRIYRLEVVAWVPDSYERLFDARLIAAGELPQSTIYPPGVALIMAPLFWFLPDTLTTMQIPIIASGVGLVAVSYAWMMRLTGDRFVAALVGLSAAAAPFFVYASRDSHYDMLGVFLIVLSLYLVPLLRGRSLVFFVAFGAMLAVLVNIRQTNVILFPALLLLWLEPVAAGLNRQRLQSELLSGPLIATTSAFLAGLVAAILLGDWFGEAGNVALTIERLPRNLIIYLSTISYPLVGPVYLLPLALLGLLHLWKQNRFYFFLFSYLILMWPLVHAMFYFATLRYMLPPITLIFVLSAMGISFVWQNFRSRRLLARWIPLFAACSIFLLFTQFVVGAAILLSGWNDFAAESDEGLAREFRPVVARLDEDSVLVSAVTRAFESTAPAITYVDLIDHQRILGTDDASIEILTSTVGRHLEGGSEVYYLYTHWEAGDDFLGGGKQAFRRFSEGLERNFALSPIMRSSVDRLDRHPWILYSVALPPTND